MKRKRMRLLGHLVKKLKPAGSKKATPPTAPVKGKKVTSTEPPAVPVKGRKVPTPEPPAATAADKTATDDKQ